jgi:hypothetical protein
MVDDDNGEDKPNPGDGQQQVVAPSLLFRGLPSARLVHSPGRSGDGQEQCLIVRASCLQCEAQTPREFPIDAARIVFDWYVMRNRGRRKNEVSCM